MEKQYNIPRGAAATKAKNKYRDKSYDRMELALPIGMKEQIKEHIKTTSDNSANAFVKRAIIETMQRDNEGREKNE